MKRKRDSGRAWSWCESCQLHVDTATPHECDRSNAMTTINDRPEQLEIAGTEDPSRIPEIDTLLHAWLAAEDEAKAARDTAKIRRASLDAELLARSLTRYAYVCARSGERLVVLVAAERKLRTAKQVKPRKAKDERKAEKRGEKKQRDAEEAVEHRRVSRAEVESEIGELDLFAATRAAMGGMQETP